MFSLDHSRTCIEDIFIYCRESQRTWGPTVVLAVRTPGCAELTHRANLQTEIPGEGPGRNRKAIVLLSVPHVDSYETWAQNILLL